MHWWQHIKHTPALSAPILPAPNHLPPQGLPSSRPPSLAAGRSLSPSRCRLLSLPDAGPPASPLPAPALPLGACSRAAGASLPRSRLPCPERSRLPSLSPSRPRSLLRSAASSLARGRIRSALLSRPRSADPAARRCDKSLSLSRALSLSACCLSRSLSSSLSRSAPLGPLRPGLCCLELLPAPRCCSLPGRSAPPPPRPAAPPRPSAPEPLPDTRFSTGDAGRAPAESLLLYLLLGRGLVSSGAGGDCSLSRLNWMRARPPPPLPLLLRCGPSCCCCCCDGCRSLSLSRGRSSSGLWSCCRSPSSVVQGSAAGTRSCVLLVP